MTEIKQVSKQDSRMNLNVNQSPGSRASGARVHQGRGSGTEMQMSMSPSPQPGYMSPVSAGQTALVSFNFLTQVPIEEFVINENAKASKLSARMKSNASIKIERELQRKIEEKKQRARLDKVLAAAQLKLKTDVEILKKREQEKRDKVDEVLERKRKQERLA